MKNKHELLKSIVALFYVWMLLPLQTMAQTTVDWGSTGGKTIEEVAINTATWDSYWPTIETGAIPNKDKTVFIYNVRTGKFLQVGGNWGTATTLAENGMRCWIEEYDTRNTSCGSKKIYKIHSVYKNYGSNIAGRSNNVLTDGESLSADRGVGVQGDATENRGYQDPDGNWKCKELWEWCIEQNPNTSNNQYFIYRPLWVNLPAMDSPGAEPDVPEGNITLIDPAAYNTTNWGITNYDNYIFAMNFFSDNDLGPVRYKPVAPTGSASGAYIAGTGGINYDMTDVDNWKFISVSEFEQAIDFSNATKGHSVDLTYLINDEGFHRTNSYHTLPNTKWNWKAVSNLAEFQALTYTTLSGTPHDTGFDFVNEGLSSSNNIGGGCDGDVYGKYYCAMLNNTGVLWQEVTVPRSGWYEISVQAAANNGDYLMCAEKENLNSTLTYGPLKAADYTGYNAAWTGTPDFDNNEWKQRSGLYLYNYDETKTTTSIRIHLDANQTMLLGVLKLSNLPYTAVDNFKLTYIDVNFVLDEDATSLDYLAQNLEDGEKSCYLNRSFVAGNWNTIILPINLTKAQFETTFGADAKLGQLIKGEGTALYFTTITASNDDDIILESGKPYIIKVANNPMTADADVVTLTGNTDNLKLGEPYYKINKVIFNAASYTAAVATTSTAPSQLRPINDDADLLNMTGSYLKQYPTDAVDVSKRGVGKVPRCYTFSSGKLTYYAKGVSLKGFRAWVIDTQDTGSAALARFVSSDIWDNYLANPSGGNATYIDGVPFVINDDPEVPIYNMNGQRMPAGDLPKGIYIKKNKKFIIR